MSTIDSRVVELKFNHGQFAKGVADAIKGLESLKKGLKLEGATQGLDSIDKASKKFSLAGMAKAALSPLTTLKTALRLDGATQGLDNVSNATKRFSLGNVLSSLNPLNAFKTALRLDGATKGLEEVSSAGRRFNMGNMAATVDGVTQRFSAMSVVAITALANIANKAINAGTQLAKSLTIAPVMEGLREYETNLNSIQTILANTSHQGTTLDQVNGALQELNEYSDKTIYNFAEMARNIGTFTAAGVNLDTSTSAIKGIANLAAVSGSNSIQASTAMYQLSQAISTGRVALMDWNSVSTAGMGGKVFQDAILETARLHGVGVDALIEKEGSFRDSLQHGWFSSEILTETLSKFTGDLTAEQLTQMGYNEEQIAGILKMGETATDAATKVKTVSQLIGTLQEAAGSGWAKTWQLVFGDFEQAKALFTNVNNVLGGMIEASAEARNQVLGEWNALGGRDVLIQGLGNAFNALMNVLRPVKEAFRQIFPATTGQELYNLTVAFTNFTEGLIAGEGTMNNIRRTFAGVFAVLGIGWEVVKAGARFFFDLFGGISSGAGSFLEATASVGDFLVALHESVKMGEGLSNFFDGLGRVLSVPINLIKQFANFLLSAFTGFDSGALDGINTAFGTFGQRLQPIISLGERVKAFFISLGPSIREGIDAIADLLSTIGDAIASSFTGANFDRALDAINTGLLGAIVLMLKRFFGGGMNVEVGGGGFFDSIKDTLGSVTDALETMQTNIKADILLKIAGALAILTASIVVLSTIDSDKLTKALVGLGVGFVGLQVALTSLAYATGVIGTLKLPLLAGSLLALAASLLLLSLALKAFSSIDGDDLIRGLFGLGASLLVVAGAMRVMPKNMVGQAVAIGILGAALIVLAGAVKLFATISWGEMAHGLAALGGALIVLSIGMRAMPKNMIAQAAALTILSIALLGIGAALKVFSTLSLGEIATGLIALGGSLLIIAAALRLMPANMLLQAVALTAVAVAITIIAGALMLFGGMSVAEIAKGLVALGGAMLILAVGLLLMNGALGGAAALLVAAGALAVLIPVLITLGSLSIGTIVTALVSLAATFVVLGVAGMLLAPITPVIMGLGVAIVLLGAGMALAGVGALAFATAFATTVAVGAAGVAVLAGILGTFISAIPAALGAFARGIIEFARVIGSAGSEFFNAFTKILSSILDALIAVIPKVGVLFDRLIQTGLQILVQAVPSIAAAGLRIIEGLLTAINNAIPRIVPLAASIITNFINAIAAKLPSIAQSGANLIISFVNSVANTIRNNSSAMGAAGANLASAVVEGMARGLTAGIGTLASKAANMAKSALNAAKSALGIASPSKEFFKVGRWSGEGMVEGLVNITPLVSREADRMGNTAVDSLRSAMSGISDALANDIDLNPTITPVLDLTGVRRDALKLGSYIPSQKISVEGAYASANNASFGYTQNRDAAAELATPAEPQRIVTFNQVNNSPKALSAADVYRQTRNQLSVAKGALTR